MSERDEAGFPPPGPSKRTVYTIDRVPGVHYVDGVRTARPTQGRLCLLRPAGAVAVGGVLAQRVI